MAAPTPATVLPTLAPVVGDTGNQEEYYRRLAQLLAEKAGSDEPISHWTQGVGRLAEALAGKYVGRKAEKAKAASDAETWAAYQEAADAGLFEGGGYGGGEYADVPGAEPVSGDDAATMQYAGGGGGGDYVNRVRDLIYKYFPQYGHDPATAFRVARGEGAQEGTWQSRVPTKGGGRETSYGPFQLLVGGGLGDRFIRETGLNPRDPSTLEEQVKFVARHLGETSWSHWMAAPKVGVGRWEGINRGAGPAPAAPVGETAEIPGAEPVASAPSPDVMAHIMGGGATPTGLTIGPNIDSMGAPPPGGAGTVPLPPVAAPPPAAVPAPRPIPDQMAEQAALRQPPVATPVHPLARVPQARPVAPAAPAPIAAAPAPATTGAIAGGMPQRPRYSPPVKNDYNAMPGRPPAAMPMRPGQLMQEPYSGPMSAQEFARQGQAAMRARKAGQQPTGLAQAAGPRRGLLQALLGRGGTPQPGMPQAAPTGVPAAPGAVPAEAAAPAAATPAAMTPQRAALTRLLASKAPDAIKLAAIKAASGGGGKRPPDYTIGNTRYSGVTNQPIAHEPGEPAERKTAKDENDVLRYLDTGEPVFPGSAAGGGGLSKDATTLRTELTKSDDFRKRQEAVPMVNSMLENLNNDVAIADVDFVYGLAKIFDPMGAVRGDDAQAITQSSSIPDQFKGAILSSLQGSGKINEPLRRELLNVAMTRVKQYDAAVQQQYKFYKGVAERAKLNETDILPELIPMGALPPEAEPAVKVGATFTAEEVAKIPENTVVQDTETGKYFRKQNGKMVPTEAP